MRGRIWLNSFINTLKEKEKTDYPENPKSDRSVCNQKKGQ